MHQFLRKKFNLLRCQLIVEHSRKIKKLYQFKEWTIQEKADNLSAHENAKAQAKHSRIRNAIKKKIVGKQQ